MEAEIVSHTTVFDPILFHVFVSHVTMFPPLPMLNNNHNGQLMKWYGIKGKHFFQKLGGWLLV